MTLNNDQSMISTLHRTEPNGIVTIFNRRQVELNICDEVIITMYMAMLDTANYNLYL